MATFPKIGDFFQSSGHTVSVMSTLHGIQSHTVENSERGFDPFLLADFKPPFVPVPGLWEAWR